MRRLISVASLLFFISLMGMTDRPRDPWVFRCVLDKQPRMVVMALHEHLWLAYDATDCSLYQAWDGDVLFEGAVYTAVHGPQPTVQGEVLLEGPQQSSWSLTGPDGEIEVTPVWRGYRFEDDHAVLLYDLKMPDGSLIHIRETPEARPAIEGGLELIRNYEVSGLSDGYTASIHLTKQRPDKSDISFFVDPESIFDLGEGKDHASLSFTTQQTSGLVRIMSRGGEK